MEAASISEMSVNILPDYVVQKPRRQPFSVKYFIHISASLLPKFHHHLLSSIRLF
jgi:hypothetical protein